MTDKQIEQSWKSATPPDNEASYFKPDTGDNKIRIVGGMIQGWEIWSGKEGERKPHRKAMDSDNPLAHTFTDQEIEDMIILPDKFTGKDEVPHYFMCFIMWDYDAERFKVCSTDKAGIYKGVLKFMDNEDYGIPTGYDITINKSGSDKKTKYDVIPSPPKPMADEVQELYDTLSSDWDLQVFFDGGHPLNPED